MSSLSNWTGGPGTSPGGLKRTAVGIGVIRVAVGANLRGGVGLFSLVKVLQIV